MTTTDIPVQPVGPSPQGSESEIIHRIQACKTYWDWLEVTKQFPDDDGDYDIAKALEENRRWSGERVTLPEGDQP